MDPISYASEMASKAIFSDVTKSESEYCRLSLRFLFSHFYSYPLFTNDVLPTRSRNGYVRRWIRNSLEYIHENGYIGFIVGLKEYGDAILRSLIRKDDTGYSYEPAESLPWAPFQVSRHLQNSCEADFTMFVKTVDWILTASSLLSKVPIDRPDLERAEKIAWIGRQSQVKSDFSLDLLESLKIATTWLFQEELDLSTSEIKHGPGSTALGHKTVREKEYNVRHCIQSLAITDGIALQSFTGRPWPKVARRPRNNKHIPVKKDAKSLRSITAEAIDMQQAQQKLKRLMYRYTDNRTVNLGHFVTYADQDPSRKLALLGSRGPVKPSTPATLDQSAASDWLSSELVVNAFSGNNLHYLMSTRTWSTDVDDGTVQLNMFAGMGSATTFPVQTTIFTAIAIVATCAGLYKSTFGHRASYTDMLLEYLPSFDGRFTQDVEKYFNIIRVYGDDVIVPELATTELFYLLEQFGLKVNTRKSFHGSLAVREACGIFAFAGYDITPVRFRVPVWNGSADFAVFESLRQFANLSFMKGWRHLYRCAIQVLRSLKPFINGKEAKRKLDGEGNPFGVPTLPFEEYRGADSVYIGIISDRPNNRVKPMKACGEEKEGLTWYTTKSDKDSDGQELYHYKQSLYKMQFEDVVPMQHGKVERGIRLVKRSLYRNEIGETTWTWVPRRVV